MSSHTVYLFRHIQTQQVLVSTRSVMKNKMLSTQLQTAGRPISLRKDLWRPLVALTGFSTPQSAQAVSDALLQRSKARLIDIKSEAEHLQRPKRLRVVDENDMVERSVASLREALEAVKKPLDSEKLLALWEQPRFMEMTGEKSWPAFVEHGHLELKNNRFVKNKSSNE
ncbi:hypothetical protein DM01DRAFT_1332404 [Hesseltinella vesiculosa]|uniref:Large ribosomal subunit protein mL67 n=1 Tax=Hesseltinella vesiculosa TaxID=101127 RepID=A0A1X2GS62_9FUNG|nr:hypothetical protein DM01DRAFT_1332404 [Hesseltinella vesiculosa]